MEAACRGARRSTNYRSGDTVAVLPGHDPAAANPYIDVALATGLGEVRNTLCAHGEGVIAIGGGAGTLSELAYAWMLGRPIVGLSIGGWSAELAGRAIDGRRDDVVMAADTAEEAVSLLRARVESSP